jgi:hypothetical protein
MTDAPPPEVTPVPSPRAASPRWPAFVPRRGLFVGLLLLYLLVVAGLIAMAVAQHARG